MNIKKIILITSLLLMVLTIGCVSASDDVASDNMTVSEDTDFVVGGNYDPDEYFIYTNDEEICIDENDDYNYDEDAEIASIILPKDAKGRFQILNNEDVVSSLNVNKNDKDHWDADDDDLMGTIYLSDFDLTKVHDGDMLTLKFFELNGGNYVAVESFTILCDVSLTDSTLQLTEIEEETENEDVDIQVENVNLNDTDKNFTQVIVAQKEGIFIITVEGEDDDIVIFRENLKTTKRHYVEIEDEDHNHYYSFGYSLADINNYIAQNIGYATNLQYLIDHNAISSGDDVYFELYEDDEDETEIDSKIMTLTISNGRLIFEDEEDEEEDVEVLYDNLETVMIDDWQDLDLLEFIVKKGIEGKIVIYLNDNKTPAFEKNLSELNATENNEDEDFNYYIITIRDLNITQAGSYIIRDYLDYENGTHIYQYDDEDPETLILYEPQQTTVDNVTIYIEPTLTTIDGTESLITINGTVGEEDEVLIYVDGNDTPIIIKLADCRKDDEDRYILGNKELNLTAGEHYLNVTCKNANKAGNVILVSRVVIELESETIYTTFNEAFVFIRFEEEDLYYTTEGMINLTIKDNAGNVIATFENDIYALPYDGDEDSCLICTGDVNAELSGNYTVIVRYFNGTEAATQIEGNVTFKSFDSEYYGTSIKDTINDENEFAITFTDLPLENNIFVEIDGNRTVEIEESDLEEWFNQEKGVYYIKYEKIRGAADGPHSISVYIDTNIGRIDLACGNVSVDLEENIDPTLTVNISNIEEGNDANVVITTNDTFTGEISLQIGNETYTVNVTNGQGSLSIHGLTADTYTVTASFKSNEIFNSSSKNSTFTVTSKQTTPINGTSNNGTSNNGTSNNGTSNNGTSQTENPKEEKPKTVTPTKKADVIKLTLKKVKIKKSAKKIVLKATLKINGKKVKGKKIIFKFKGKTYKAKTKKKGVAKVTIKKKVLKKLKVGKKVTYSAKYSNKTVKKTVKVKK